MSFYSHPKKPFEQYYRLDVSGPTKALCETKSNNVIVLTHTSFDQNTFYFLQPFQEAVDAFNAVMKDFGFFSRSQQTLNPSTHSQNFKPGLL